MTGAIKESGKQQLTEKIIVLRACCHGFGEICRASCTGPAFGYLLVMLNVLVSQCGVSAMISSSTLETVVMVCLWFCLDFSTRDWIIWRFLFCFDFFLARVSPFLFPERAQGYSSFSVVFHSAVREKHWVNVWYQNVSGREMIRQVFNHLNSKSGVGASRAGFCVRAGLLMTETKWMSWWRRSLKMHNTSDDCAVFYSAFPSMLSSLIFAQIG